MPVLVLSHDALDSVEHYEEHSHGASGYNPESSDLYYVPDDYLEPETFAQAELYNIVHDLNLSKDIAELLAFEA